MIGDIALQNLRASLKERVISMDGRHKRMNLTEIEDAWQYGDSEAMYLFDRVLNRDTNLYFVRGFFLNTVREFIDPDIVPSLTLEHLNTFSSIPGGSVLKAEEHAAILKLIIERPEDNLLIASILRDRHVFDPERIVQLINEQKLNSKAFSSGVL